MKHSSASFNTFSPGAFASPVKKENVWLIPLFFFILNLIIKSFSVTKSSFDLDEAWHTCFSQKSLGEILKIAAPTPMARLTRHAFLD
jgi:hypothetical protein